jgi:hypothetical protein
LGKLRFKNIGFFFNFNFFLGQNDISFWPYVMVTCTRYAYASTFL